MQPIALVTVVTRNYLHYALSLKASCIKWMPDSDFHVVLLDSLPPGETHQVAHIPGNQLGIDRWQTFAFQYTPFELACAAKPFAMRHLINRGYEKVIYLDSDIAIYDRLRSVERALEKHSVALTPHLLQPLPLDGGKPSEKLFLSSGAFNGGLVACNADPSARAFLDWWACKLENECYVDLSRGMFVDQKWLDLVPSLFSDVAIIRSPGCNTGYWTLSQFPLTGDSSSGFRVGDEPLECFHFSNFLPSNPYEFMRSQTRVDFDTSPALRNLVAAYHKVLATNQSCKYTALGCELELMSDGTKIKPEWREAIRRGYRNLKEVKNPFDVAANPDLIQRLQRTESRAKRWRGDWRERLPSELEKKQRIKRLKNYWKYLKSKFLGSA